MIIHIIINNHPYIIVNGNIHHHPLLSIIIHYYPLKSIIILLSHHVTSLHFLSFNLETSKSDQVIQGRQIFVREDREPGDPRDPHLTHWTQGHKPPSSVAFKGGRQGKICRTA